MFIVREIDQAIIDHSLVATLDIYALRITNSFRESRLPPSVLPIKSKFCCDDVVTKSVDSRLNIFATLLATRKNIFLETCPYDL